MTLTNHKFLLAARPIGMPKRSDWTYTEEPIGEPKEGELLVQVQYISLDPAMRMWINDARSYMPPVGIGELMRALGLGVVTASRNPRFAVGDHVSGSFGMQEYALTDGRGVTKVNPKAPLPKYLSVFGMPGMTAYFGLLDTGQPKAGEMVVVSAAAGAVGAIVGQIAKIKGCRVVGIAGGEPKCRFVKDELGFDVCVDHRQPELADRLKAACPDGIDVYFENVGGQVLDAVLPLLNNFARIPVCGLIAYYSASELPAGPDHVPLLLRAILVKRLTFRGFIVVDYASQFADFISDMTRWLTEGRIKFREDITDGLENAPRELIRLLKGENFGKKIICVAPDPTRL